MKPSIEKAIEVLNKYGDNHKWMGKSVYKSDLIISISEALGYLKGYELSAKVLSEYVCSHCDVSGVKLWRGIGSADEKWCAACGMKQAGLKNTIGDDGRYEGEFGPSDQIYSSDKGQNLLPYIPTPDGETWGYTSVPTEGCIWWRNLPTGGAK